MKLIHLLEGSKEWEGDFELRGSHRTIHAPVTVKGDCVFYNISLRSLKGSPVQVFGRFTCSGNQLTSLEHGPKIVNGAYDCSGNRLRNLVGAPDEVSRFMCQNNPTLTSLEGIPNKITLKPTGSESGLTMYNTGLTSLHNIHKQIKIVHSIDLRDTPIVKQILGLILIPTLTKVVHNADQPPFEIINKWLGASEPLHERMNACQDELIEAGFEDFAEL